MAVGTIMDPRLLQAADGKAERIRDKVDRCQRATAGSIGILLLLRKVRRELKELRSIIEDLEVSTDENRELARDRARSFMDLAKKIGSAEDKYKKRVWPIFGFIRGTNLGLFDETYCLAEDAAETLALVASREFMESLESDLRRIHGGA